MEGDPEAKLSTAALVAAIIDQDEGFLRAHMASGRYEPTWDDNYGPWECARRGRASILQAMLEWRGPLNEYVDPKHDELVTLAAVHADASTLQVLLKWTAPDGSPLRLSLVDVERALCAAIEAQAVAAVALLLPLFCPPADDFQVLNYVHATIVDAAEGGKWGALRHMVHHMHWHLDEHLALQLLTHVGNSRRDDGVCATNADDGALAFAILSRSCAETNTETLASLLLQVVKARRWSVAWAIVVFRPACIEGPCPRQGCRSTSAWAEFRVMYDRWSRRGAWVAAVVVH